MKPFLTIPGSSSDRDDGNTNTNNHTNGNGIDIPIYFQEDWHTGIGGGLWSTGLAFSQYLTTNHAAMNLQRIAANHQNSGGISILELGSGNGLLSVCILGLAQYILQQQQQEEQGVTKNIISDLVITDMADHLSLIQKTLDANKHLCSAEAKTTRVHVLEHQWGTFLPTNQDTDQNNCTNTLSNDSTTSTTKTAEFPKKVQQGVVKFDLILGSDVAYHEDLYDILIASLVQFSHDTTTILIGCTMADTKPQFFQKLKQTGFDYEKFADHLLPPNFRGRTFGIFVITPTRQH